MYFLFAVHNVMHDDEVTFLGMYSEKREEAAEESVLVCRHVLEVAWQYLSSCVCICMYAAHVRPCLSKCSLSGLEKSEFLCLCVHMCFKQIGSI